MRTYITQKDIKTYKTIAKRSWHDQEWHDFMNADKSEAIEYALEQVTFKSDLAEVQKVAMEYMASKSFFN